MTSAREAARQALLARLQNWLPYGVERNRSESVGADERLAILRDGVPVLDEELLGGPPAFAWEDPLTLELHAQGATPAEIDALIDETARLIAEGLEDWSLGGAVDYAECGPPERIPAQEDGLDPLAAVRFVITLSYCSTLSSG